MAVFGAMGRRLEVYGLAALVMGGVLAGFFGMMRSGFDPGAGAQALALALPLLVVCLLALRSAWVGLGLGALALTSVTPLPMLHRTEIGMALCLLVGGLTVVWRLLNWRVRVPLALRGGAGWFLFAALWLWVRFILDRPGSANMGARGGGLGEASMFLMGTVAYFVLAANAADSWDGRRTLLWVIGLLLAGLAIDLALGLREDPALVVLSLFGRQAWLGFALLLAWSLQRSLGPRGEPRGAVLFYGVACLMLLMAVLTPHRSRPLYALGILLATTAVFRVSRRFVLFLALLVLLGAGVIFFVGPERIPMRSVRSLSTVLPMPEDRLKTAIWEYRLSHETGWESSFRMELNRIAWSNIRNRPLTGRGFGFSQQDLSWAMSRGGYYADAAQGLAVSGMFHNAVVELAVFCGLPAALMFLVAAGVGVWRFWGTVRRITDPHLKILCVGGLGYLVAEFGQMVINGGARDFFYVCVVLGFMKGVCRRVEREPQLTAAAGAAPAGPVPEGQRAL